MLHPGSDTHALTGLISGLKVGRNALEVSTEVPGIPPAELVVINHPIEGPVFWDRRNNRLSARPRVSCFRTVPP